MGKNPGYYADTCISVPTAKQEAILHKLDEAKEARVTLNRMRREHQDKVRQQEKEQALLARMQMEQKLALLRQQKQEQLDFEKTLQQQRLDSLQQQRSEYEQKLQAQREKERQLLIAQETQVLQQQFGSNGVVAPPPPTMMPPTSVVGGAHPYGVPPSTSTYNPVSLQFQSLSLHDPTQAGPLPPKLDHSLGLDQSVPPPPYHPSTFHQPPQTLSSLPTDSMATGYASYQQPPPPSLQPQFPQQQQQPGGELLGMSMNHPSPSAIGGLQGTLMDSTQPHSLENILSVTPLPGSGGGGQPSSLPTQLPSSLPPQAEPAQQFQQGFGAPPLQTGGVPPIPSMMTYQQQPPGAGYSGQPTGPPPPGVSFHAPTAPGPTQQFGGGAPVQLATGGFIPNGAHQGQAPPQPHPPAVGRPRQESQPPLISFD